MESVNPWTNDLLLERYRSCLELRNYAPRTIEGQLGSLKLLRRFLDETRRPDLIAVTTATLTEFQHWHFYRPTQNGTVRGVPYQNRVLAAVKGLFKFLREENLLGHDPAAPLDYGREPETLPRNILTPAEARKIIETPDTAPPWVTGTAPYWKSFTPPESAKTN